MKIHRSQKVSVPTLHLISNKKGQCTNKKGQKLDQIFSKER